MYFVLYDKDFKVLGQEGTRCIESFKLQRRSYDFSALQITGAKIDSTLDPFWISLNNNDGSIYYMTLFGVASTDEKNKTKLEAKDLKKIFDNEIVLDFSFSQKLSDMLLYVWEQFISQIDIGFPISEFNVDDITDINIVSDVREVGKKVYNVWNLLSSEIYYYNIHIDYKIDPFNKKITFYVKKNNKETRDLVLSDFGITELEKVIGDINMVAVWDKELTNIYHTYYLYNDNTIGTNASDIKRIYPAKCKIYNEESIDEGKKKAVLDLALARYYENINITLNNYTMGERLMNVDFTTSFDIYSDTFYKSLPIGEIEEDEKGTKIIKIGYRPQELTQLF